VSTPAIDAVLAKLRATGRTEFSRGEILAALGKAGLRPWKSLDRAVESGWLCYTGTDCSNGKFVFPKVEKTL